MGKGGDAKVTNKMREQTRGIEKKAEEMIREERNRREIREERERSTR